MDAGRKGFKQILSHNYVVPYYQRLYSWKEEQWESLLDSLIDNQKNNQYFLGSIISKTTNTSNVIELIDGQQRLTTLCILMKVIHDNIEDEEYKKDILKELKLEDRKGTHYKIEHTEENAKDFKNIIDSNFDKINNKSKIYQSYKYFNKELKTRAKKNPNFILEKELGKLYDFIIEKCYFIHIELHQEDDEMLIFNTMNSTGLKLSTLDLLKNWIFQDETLKNKYLQTWQEIFENDNETINFWSEIVSKNKGNTNSDLILYTASLIEETKNDKFSTYQMFTNYKDLFSTYKKQIDKENKIKKEVIVQSIFKIAKIYIELLENRNIYEIDYFNNKLNLLLFTIEKTQYKVLYPIILYLETFKPFSSEETNNLYSNIFSLSMSINLTKSETSVLNKMSAQILNILQIKGLKETQSYIVDKIKEIFNTPKNKQDIISKLENINFQRRVANNNAILPLSLIESYKRGKAAEELFEYTNNLSIEHIIPKNNKDINVDKKDRYLIGNLVILSKSNNSKVSNAIFLKKKHIYQTSTLKIVQELVNFEDFSSLEDINKRGATLAQDIYNVLNLDKIIINN